MSDSELSEPTSAPSAAAIEASLKRAVRDIQKSGEDVTINNARKLAEEALDLDEGFLKGAEWKGKSKEIITSAVEQEDEPESPKKPTKPAPKTKAKPSAKKGRKRKSDDDEEAAMKPQRSRKAARVESEDEASEPESEVEDDESAFEEEEEVKPKKKAARKPAKKPAPRKGKKAAEVVESEDEEVEPANSKSAPKVGCESWKCPAVL